MAKLLQTVIKSGKAVARFHKTAVHRIELQAQAVFTLACAFKYPAGAIAPVKENIVAGKSGRRSGQFYNNFILFRLKRNHFTCNVRQIAECETVFSRPDKGVF